MSEVLFYHLERSKLEDVLPGLLEKTLARNWRAVVAVGADDRIEVIDGLLWTYTDDSFLPHGTSDASHQPVFVTTVVSIPSGFDVLFLVDGATADAQRFAEFTRTVVMFGETDAPAARTLWKDVKATGVSATYWRQSSNGKWEKAA